jgi:ATP-dependent helicase HrpA
MTAPDTLDLRLDATLLRDRPRLRRQWRQLGRRPDAAALARFERAVAASAARVASRRARLPEPTFPGELPISARLDDIAAALERHQVVVVAGETGSGKTTQLPKL